MEDCTCHCHNNHEGTGFPGSDIRCKCIPNCKHCNPATAEKERWDAYDAFSDPIFDLLNCYQVDGSEIRDGMAFIDSGEAEKLTKKIRQLLERESKKQ